jgi:hypothetical protein
LTSGYSADLTAPTYDARAGKSFVSKPCPPQQLLATVRTRLDGM